MAGAEKVMAAALKDGKPLTLYKRGTVVHGGGGMSLLHGYKYTLEANPGADFDPRFKPALTPAEMLFMGVFEGKYLNDCTSEFPQEWFLMAGAAGRLSPDARDVNVNYFGVDSRQPLTAWRENGWVPGGARGARGARGILADRAANPDERGWFQWYCRYWLGRRIPELDNVQIGRWRGFKRHVGLIKRGCGRGAVSCRPRERQALLQWAYNPFI